MKVLMESFAGRSSSQMPVTSFLVPDVDDLPEILFQPVENYQKRCAAGVFDCHKNYDKIMLIKDARRLISYGLEPRAQRVRIHFILLGG